VQEIRDLQGAPFRDAEIVSRIRAGDQSAFDALYITYFSDLWRVTNRLVRSADVANDIVQDVFVSLWEHREVWTVRTTVRAYLYGAVRHRVSSRFRHEGVRARMREMVADELPGMGQPPISPEEHVTATDEEGVVRLAIRELPERQRLALALWLDDLTLGEIAAIMDISSVAVWKLLTKAKQAVRNAFEER
jgi:RNA polymerase sigma-70 factor (ECF subfamily)